MLQLAGDLCLLDEVLHEFRPAGVVAEQHLDRHVAAQVGVAAFQDRPHAAAGDLAVQLQPAGGLRGRRHLGRAGPNDRGDDLGGRLAQLHPRHRRQQGAQRPQDAAAGQQRIRVRCERPGRLGRRPGQEAPGHGVGRQQRLDPPAQLPVGGASALQVRRPLPRRVDVHGALEDGPHVLLSRCHSRTLRTRGFTPYPCDGWA